MANKLKIGATDEMCGQRLDKAISLIPEIATRSRAAYLIEHKKVLVNSTTQKASYQVRAHDIIEVDLPTETTVEIVPLDLKLDIIFEDEEVLVVNKPAGLVVHPAAGHEQDTLVNALIHHTKNLSMKFGENRPGIVHRIDKETSGLLVIAKNDFAHAALAEQFKNKTTHRIYNAVCFGLTQEKGKIESYLARHPIDRKKYASILGKNKKKLPLQEIPPDIGKWAVTHFEKINSIHGLTYLKIKLETGRTHQIRVHMSELGHPLVGDVLYGAGKKIKNIDSNVMREEIKKMQRFLLHASELGFTHPRTGESLIFKVDWPEQDLQILKGWDLI